MKLYRRHDKRVDFENDSTVACQLVHPYDHLICLRGQLLDLGAGGIGLRIAKSDVPMWAVDHPVIVRADLPGTGELLRRMARMSNKRRDGATPEFGFIWEARGARSLAYERVQSQRLQRFFLRRERDERGTLVVSHFGVDADLRLLTPTEELSHDAEIVRIERIPASIV
jgi:hypothetical protein